MLITVFTPTYNRAHLLPILYHSLLNQTYKVFEWLIIDDGSTDATKDKVRGWIKEGLLDIRYEYQHNGGKHRAINKGVKMAQGELFFIVDSDDKLPVDALSLVNEQYNFIKNKDEFAGVCGLKALFNGELLPGHVNYDVLECKGLDYYHRYGGSDIAEVVIRTSILRKFPFPEYEDEKFCAESAVWNQIGNQYFFRYFRKVIYLCDFLHDGLSANSLKARMDNPLSAMHLYSELCTFDVPLKVKIKAAINYWRFYCCNKGKVCPRISLTYFPLFLIGYMLHIKDKGCNYNK